MGKIFTSDYFLKKAKEIWKDEYDYSNVVFIDKDTEVIIICKKDGHPEFEKKPKQHVLRLKLLTGKGWDGDSRLGRSGVMNIDKFYAKCRRLVKKVCIDKPKSIIETLSRTGKGEWKSHWMMEVLNTFYQGGMGLGCSALVGPMMEINVKC